MSQKCQNKPKTRGFVLKRFRFFLDLIMEKFSTRGPMGHIPCTRVQCASTDLTDLPERPSCFSDQPEKHKLGRGRWDRASCQVSLISVQQFQRKSRKCISQSEAWVAILFFFFSIGPKHKLGRGHWDLASWQVSLNSVAILFVRSALKKPTNLLVRGCSDLASCQVSLNLAVSEEKSKMY